MTPEEIERTMEFILQCQADSAAWRTDVDGWRREAEAWRSDYETWRRESEARRRESEVWRREFEEKASHQREVLEGLMKISSDLLLVSRQTVAKVTQIEGRLEGVEELTKLLRTWFEANLKRGESGGLDRSQP